MAIEAILEKEWNIGFWGESIKSKIVVHCSCGRDFKIKERFSVEWIGAKPNVYVRPYVCPGCKKKSYLAHFTLRETQFDFCYSVRILSKKKP